MKNKLNQIISLLKKELPGQQPKPTHSDPLDVLVATILSQNTTDKTSYQAYCNLKDEFESWEDVMSSPVSKIKNAIRVCGLANQKAVWIKKLLLEIKLKHGVFNLDNIKNLGNKEIYDELLKYDGVGLKTVSCVLAFALGRDVFPVDTHVHRLSNRLGLVKSSSANNTFEQINDIIPKGKKFLLHTLLIRFGRKICRSQNPLCGQCVLYDLCVFPEKENYASKKKAQSKENNFIILEHV